jgi:hypothetical protein
MLNNQAGQGVVPSTVMEIAEPDAAAGSVEVVWNYVFDFENPYFNFVQRMGGVTELPNGNRLIATGTFNRVFEVNKSMVLVWDAYLSRRDSANPNFYHVPTYRSRYMRSLFPCYFTAESAGKTKVRITNEGTSDDTYDLFRDLKDGTRKFLVQILVKSESSLEVGIPGPASDDPILIRSKANPSKQRKVRLL